MLCKTRDNLSVFKSTWNQWHHGSLIQFDMYSAYKSRHCSQLYRNPEPEETLKKESPRHEKPCKEPDSKGNPSFSRWHWMVKLEIITLPQFYTIKSNWVFWKGPYSFRYNLKLFQPFKSEQKLTKCIKSNPVSETQPDGRGLLWYMLTESVGKGIVKQS